MKEMLGGCCVCSDERGWTENPLVYCDGAGCNVAVHQACYGIVQVPTGPWFCRKCESQERTARVRCELCPSRDGALKRTDAGGWAHVVCALYIPEVRFGNVTTMEPIVLAMVPQERYHKSCSLCSDSGHASLGACMQCNKAGCKQYFHVTCAQASGLLCEEAGNYMDNVKYCGYCQHHYQKLKKDSNIKTIPAFKPPSSHPPTLSDDDDDDDSDDAPQTSTTRGRKSTKIKKPIYTSDSSGDDEDVSLPPPPPALKTPPKRAAKEKPTVYDDPEFDDDSNGAKTKFESKTRDDYKRKLNIHRATAKQKRSSEKNLPAIVSMYDSLTKGSTQKKSQGTTKRSSTKEKESPAPKEKDAIPPPPSAKRPKTPSSSAVAAATTTAAATTPPPSSSCWSLDQRSTSKMAVIAREPSSTAVAKEPPSSAPGARIKYDGNLVPPHLPKRPDLSKPSPSSDVALSSLEAFLEKQWEQSGMLLMKHAHPFDVAALLSCLHQLRSSNESIEDRIATMQARKDQLLAINARLSLPIGLLHSTNQLTASGMTSIPAAAALSRVRSAINGLPAAMNGVAAVMNGAVSTNGLPPGMSDLQSVAGPSSSSRTENGLNGSAKIPEKDRFHPNPPTSQAQGGQASAGHVNPGSSSQAPPSASHPPPPPPHHHGYMGAINESVAAAMAANGRLPTLQNYNNYASQHKSKR
ncbi:protein AF-10-like [Galendromus occidentalis]|uniref:Protein AF-10-like n=1 Tax=Galendromus occidentalis TaxID=34638 RepID=A0AAJ7SGU3_9ACAR|nr:protein AF-10-like [Galendromus occidentalis]